MRKVLITGAVTASLLAAAVPAFAGTTVQDTTVEGTVYHKEAFLPARPASVFRLGVTVGKPRPRAHTSRLYLYVAECQRALVGASVYNGDNDVYAASQTIAGRSGTFTSYRRIDSYHVDQSVRYWVPYRGAYQTVTFRCRMNTNPNIDDWVIDYGW